MMDLILRRIARAFWFTLAVLFLLESWLWDHVKVWLRLLAEALGVKRIEERIASLIRDLSPWATLTVFIIPVLTILPLKIYAVAQMAQGHFAYGLCVIFAAKALGLGVTAFLFDLCRDKLLQMSWFASFYHLVLRIRAWAHDLVAPVRARLHELRLAAKAMLAEALGAGRSQFLRRLKLIRAMARRGGGA
ncbi:hypothetical protein [Methylocystis heyeri]|nr:hypothetical protein [Methylocystis heyeri]